MRRRPRLYKRKGDTVWSFYFFDQDGRRIYRKTDIPLSSPRKAEQYADGYVEEYSKDNSKVRIKLKKFASDFFVWNKCSWIKRQLAKGRRFSEAQAQHRRAHLVNHILPKFGNRYIDIITQIELKLEDVDSARLVHPFRDRGELKR